VISSEKATLGQGFDEAPTFQNSGLTVKRSTWPRPERDDAHITAVTAYPPRYINSSMNDLAVSTGIRRP
jgi:hypothetical protein